MSLILSGLPSTEVTILQTLHQNLIAALRKASNEMKLAANGQTTQSTGFSQTWFGDVSPNWLRALAKDLSKSASLINVMPIKIHAAPLSERVDAYACSLIKRKEDQEYARKNNPLTIAKGKHFEIELHKKWFKAPVFRTPNNPDSRFQTLMHEISHIFLCTKDQPSSEGVDTCKLLAQFLSPVAKTNADNWGYFVEEFR
ncbi:M35 family metallo-endopeptidase [Actibacterium sp. 188UL27-1]|uniref:M35 family metallo-endopeptidase n=1 Tax=Actibacterium sp. 188UL27-1 TaxID=2786961 RepID=UPI00195CE436|nr:M35 family metallo-endopeptidase [Actibacterium sp. 188UL27-1]MBM7066814.1 hypothetical protein [Actibacterium sp. 188UL27-1]